MAAKKPVPAARASKQAPRAGKPAAAQPRAARNTPAAPRSEPPTTLRVTNRYDAAGSGRRMAGWNPPASGPNRAVQGLQKIRDRSRDATRNDWSGAASAQRWTTNIVGIGIVPRFKRVTSRARKQQLVDLWTDWCATADADGVLSFYGLQTLAVRSWLESGEVFVRLRPRMPEAGLPVPLQIQLVEADYVPLLDADQWPGLPAGNTIRQGIERNRYGRRIAYWMYRDHPGDDSTSIDSSKLIRVAASQVLHVFEPKRPGQLRGVPELASVLARLRNIGDYDDAVLERQKLANLFVAWIRRSLPNAADIEYDSMTGLPVFYDTDGAPMPSLEPGMTQELQPGEDVVFANPPEAGTTYSDYMRTQHLGTAAAAGLPYEILSGDIKEISDRTLRVLINEFRRLAEQRQWQIVIPMLCQPVMNAWVQAAAMAGLIDAAEVDDVRRVEWAPHGWSYIHPVQDVQGKQMEVEAGFRSRSSVIAERGDDPEEVDREIAEDDKRQAKLNPNRQASAQSGRQPAQPGQPSGDDPNNPDQLQRDA